MSKKISSAKWIGIGGLLLIFGLLIFLGVTALSLPQLPTDISQLSLTAGTSFYADNGQMISSLSDRQMVQLNQISPYFLKAIVATEDAEFYRHHGINKRGLLRALLRDLREGRIVEGGSSITQQLAKNLFLTFEQTAGRKFDEMLLAIQIERHFSKDEILQAYCNQICFGPGIFGVEMASQVFLGKHADELNLPEAAFLANLPRSPGNYNPYRNYDLAKKRQDIVLTRMLKVGAITPEEKEKALAEPLAVRPLNLNWGQANYFVSYAQSLVEKKFGRDIVNYGGLKIYTTLDDKMQAAAKKAVEEGLAEFDQIFGLPDYKSASRETRPNYPQAALVAIDPKTGKIKALVGGRDFQTSEFNRAIESNRLPGSSFKPIVYLTAIDQANYNPAQVIEDRPVRFGRGNDAWAPQNFDRQFRGPIILKWAVMQSINVVAAKTIADVTVPKVVEMARRMGITSPIQPDLTLALGTSGVSPLEMAGAYAVLANEGVYLQPNIVKRVESNDGKILMNPSPESHRVADPQSVYLLVDMLKGVFENGTAKSAALYGFTRPAAGKTGTTSDNRDAWFIGFTPQLVTAVWVGFDDNRQMLDTQNRGVTGGRGALPIWVAFMKEALKDHYSLDFPIPPGIIFENVDQTTGEIAPPDDPAAIRVALKYGTNLSQ